MNLTRFKKKNVQILFPKLILFLNNRPLKWNPIVNIFVAFKYSLVGTELVPFSRSTRIFVHINSRGAVSIKFYYTNPHITLLINVIIYRRQMLVLSDIVTML